MGRVGLAASTGEIHSWSMTTGGLVLFYGAALLLKFGTGR